MIELKPESYQWGPLIFAHNTPSLKGFWEKKWSRVLEVMTIGDRWITGCGNHDTVRRGNQIDLAKPINWRLGKNLPEVLQNAYDSPAVNLWVYGFSPGLPMDFINATMHAPWLFFRNTDERYGVKVVSEEIGFLSWQITPRLYSKAHCFTRLKLLGFRQLKQLQEFGQALNLAMIEKDYVLADVVEMLHSCVGGNPFPDIPPFKELSRGGMVRFLKKLDEDRLKNFALMFMEDCFHVCNVSHYHESLDQAMIELNLALRNFRHQHPWLAENMTECDRFDKITEGERSIFYGVRSNPDNTQTIAMVSHLEGEPITLNLPELLELNDHKWSVAIKSPGLKIDDLTSITLNNSDGLLLISSL